MTTNTIDNDTLTCTLFHPGVLSLGAVNYQLDIISASSMLYWYETNTAIHIQPWHLSQGSSSLFMHMVASQILMIRDSLEQHFLPKTRPKLFIM